MPLGQDAYSQEFRRLPAVLLLDEVRDSNRTIQQQPTEKAESGGQVLLGGFLARERGEELRQRLLSLGIDGYLIQKEVAAEQEYWVYLPPLSSRAATLRQLKELQARKLDGFLIAQGELANGISLGIFPHQNSAEAVQERLKDAGYQAQIKQISRMQSAYWFEVSVAGQRLLDEKSLQGLMKDFPEMRYAQGN